MFPMTITIHNAAQLNAVLASMDPSAVPAKVAVAVASSTKETVVTNGPSSTTGQIDSSPQSAAAAPEPTPEVKTTPVVAGVTYPELAGMFTRFGQVKGRAAAVEILAKYGADNLKKIPEDKWAEVLATIKPALGA